jgi:NifU-like protein involved in Fe-S cluster formation
MTAPAGKSKDPYSALVRRYFANPVHAGQLPDGYHDAVVAQAAETATGACIILSAVVDDTNIRLLRYRVFGCPHLIAAAEAFCAETEGKPPAALTKLDVRKLMDKLTIPAEKAGRLFILEDAVKALHITLSCRFTDEDSTGK